MLAAVLGCAHEQGQLVPPGLLANRRKDWIRAQPLDADVALVPASFVKTEPEWDAWWQQNRERIEWSAAEQRYRAKKP